MCAFVHSRRSGKGGAGSRPGVCCRDVGARLGGWDKGSSSAGAEKRVCSSWISLVAPREPAARLGAGG